MEGKTRSIYEYLKNYKIYIMCDIEEFVKTHLYKLRGVSKQIEISADRGIRRDRLCKQAVWDILLRSRVLFTGVHS